MSSSLPCHVIIALSFVTLCGDVQLNPGPLQSGVLNCHSATHKIATIHVLITDHNLDVPFPSETWFTSDTLQCVLLDVAPSGYAALDVVRSTGSGKANHSGRLAAVFHESNGWQIV